MTMHRFRRVAELWNWLPGFRAVAEHESVHKAAQQLAVSPSALSRTVKLLESALNAPLFARHGTGLQLTDLGSELLSITRNVMRQVDDCIAREDARRGGEGPVCIGTASDVAAAVVARMLARRASSVFKIDAVRVTEETAVDELLHGNVDLVVAESSPRDEQLACEALGSATFGIYAAPGRAAPDVETAAYVAVAGGPPVPEGAQIACSCESVDMARAICETSTLLCTLPDTLVRGTALRRLADADARVIIHAIRRAPISPDRDVRLAELVTQLRECL